MTQAMTYFFYPSRALPTSTFAFPFSHHGWSKFCTRLALFAFVVAFLGSGLAGAALVDVWRANDLNALDSGDAVGTWSSASNRVGSAVVGSQPTLLKNATISGDSAVQFNASQLTIANSPVAGLTTFSMALVFRVDQPGTDEGSGWSTKSGIVDANQNGAVNDWGFSVRETGYVAFGTGSGGTDSTVYLDNQPTYPSVVDGKYHVLVCTWGGGSQAMYFDGRPVKTGAASTGARDNAGLSFGAIHTGEPARRFAGSLSEVQFFNSALTGSEATNLITQLSAKYLTNSRPVIMSFTVNPTTISQPAAPVQLSWAVSNATLVSLNGGIGTVAATGSVQVLPTTTFSYTLTASNSSGVRTAEQTVTLVPGVPTANSQALSVIKNTARNITLTGSDPQNSLLTFQIVQAPQHGSLTGTPPEVTYTPQGDYVGPDFFTFNVNDGYYDSDSANLQLYVVDEARAPHGIYINPTALNATAAPGSFLAMLRAVDTNRSETFTFTLVPGLGATNNSMFTISGNQLRAGTGFPTATKQTLYIRVRATDATGLFVEKNFLLEMEIPDRRVVINEIHYNPNLNTIREEFIELYNPSNAPVNLSLWRLRDGADFVFTNGTTIPAGGYLIVASDPATIQSRYGKTAQGPWTGNLSSDGERVTLRDPADNIVDEVDYGSEFPWPIAANGNGPSMELLNPALDNNLGSSWASPLNPAVPSPGAVNQVSTTNAAPNIRQVNHTPQQPSSTNQVVVTAKITDPQGVAAVVLHYQVITPGNYIPAFLPLTVAQLNATPLAAPPANPAFEASTNWIAVTMQDDGMDGDAVAGDDVYSVTLAVRPNRTLVRYRITCTDALGASRRSPFADDPSLNFAYFVYDTIPDYSSVASSDLQTLPIYFLLTRKADFDVCNGYSFSDQITQFSGSLANEARFAFNWAGAFVYDGEVYDHIRYRLRGANGRYQNGKRNFRFKFNDGRNFAAKDEFGNPYPRKWASLSSAKGQSNRGTLTFGVNEYLNYFLMSKVGVPAPNSHYVHWRVVRGAVEAPNVYDGDFYGLTWVQEDYDANFLEAHQLPKGNLYKLINATRASDPYLDMVQQRRYQGGGAVTNGGDAVRIQNELLNPNVSQTDAWLLANVNYPNWYAYHTICEAVRNYDTWPSANKNAAWFFDTDYNSTNQFNGRLWTLPWDMTDTWGPTWNAGQDLAWNGIWGSTASTHLNLQRDYRNTMREIRDLLFQPDQINPLIDAVAARIAPISPGDLARWSYSTLSGSAYGSMSLPGPGFTGGVSGYVQDLKDFMFIGGSRSWWLDRTAVTAGGWIVRLDTLANDAAIPIKPTIYYVGPTNYPQNTLTFECLPFADPQGAGTFAAMQWRLAEVRNTNQPAADARVIPPLEWDALWTSGTLTTFSNRITVPGIYVPTNKVYRARVRHQDNTGRWSKWSDAAQFSVTESDLTAQLRAGLRFNEIMYHPPAFSIYSGDDLEFLELKNTGASPLDLSGLTFTAGITFAFTNGTTLAAGQGFLIGRSTVALQARYPGLTVNGIYSGKLDNSGETLRLSTPAGATILEVTYNNSPPWPATADGLGWSLVLHDALASTYRASTTAGGSPGAENPASTTPGIVINEVLAHTDPPLSDSIELFNPTAGAVNIGGWFLSDDPERPKKYRIVNGTAIPAGGYCVFVETNFNSGVDAFALSSLGDEIYLFAGDASTNLTGYVHAATFGANLNSVSLGRCVNSLGEEDFVAMTTRTLGSTNSQPRIGPVVISEIMFQPPLLGANENFDAEFIELQNVTSTNVPLGSLAFPTNTWRLRNAVDFDFPEGVTLPVEGRLLVVGFDPATNTTKTTNFRTSQGVSNDVPIYGPWSGRLGNEGESIELKLPDTPQQLDGFVPYVQVEKISYRPQSPWPTGAAGTGQSLQRATLLVYGNDPANWFAASATAGSLSTQTSQDVDADGVPDVWEMLNATDPFVADGGLDADNDGQSNYEEWLAATDPQSAASVLKFSAILGGDNEVTLQFTAMANRSYSIVGASTVDAQLWFNVANIAVAPTNRIISVNQPVSDTQFFRLVAPGQF
jgi:Lamin Tail Domain/CotH kinase protein/Concanavalin A-like lectin/glucanases superfamily/Bacterial Ig domain